MRNTIFALSSGAPPSGVAVVRISGPNVRFGLETLVGFVPEPRNARLCDIKSPGGDLLDRGLVLFFPGPASFTGEDVAEFQIHGSRASIEAVLGALRELSGYRPAEAGEFTRRAFEHGRMDLTAVEGLSDLIRAETEAQRKQALFQADGGLHAIYQSWADRLTHARAMIEAELDFSDEEDIPGSVSDRIWPDVAALLDEIRKHLSQAAVAKTIRHGFHVALIGAPNAGKSSLINHLAQRDVAIVSATPGTTRDVVEARLDVYGHLVVLLDTAGIHETDNPIEQDGIRRSLAVAQRADLVLSLEDPFSTEPNRKFEKTALAFDDVETVRIYTKGDLGRDEDVEMASGGLSISVVDGSGIDELLELIAERLSRLEGGADAGLPTRARHEALLRDCAGEIDNCLGTDGDLVEVRSDHLRRAALYLGRITGAVDVEDLLGVIFQEFCVGK
ncbi:tRNA uridine-5-carboxymethylaminomethyl(34) synthesis GTPase MnmE [uncultured Hoeflea sp.]|uniref:tRNA uridine-5-carboxymethylaminomethyl(34) synthesis GTPase MnmE n=1 Tax=uncultured Hoeflea sp. TaxID=538666 RepID=UPI002639ECC6|nr:tRNA uridine-5-carboxymethylaminomethyl(34) synthesis GTPase MnmE [uncultured Hoeflea sp.]